MHREDKHLISEEITAKTRNGGTKMTTDLTRGSDYNAPALQPEVSPWREAVNDEVGASFGAFLKFTKGDWTVGEEAKPVPVDARFVVNMEEYYRGWVRWWDGKPTNHMIGRVIDRHRVP